MGEGNGVGGVGDGGGSYFGMGTLMEKAMLYPLGVPWYDETDRYAEKERQRMEATPQELKDFGARYLKKNYFQAGDLVTWKVGMKNRHFFEYGEPVVVIETESGRREKEFHLLPSNDTVPSDIRIGKRDEGGNFSTAWIDSHRLKPFDEE